MMTTPNTTASALGISAGGTAASAATPARPMPSDANAQHKRWQAVEELVTTERTYVSGMQALCNVFYNPIRLTPKSLLLRRSTRNDADKANQRIITNDEISTIFGNCDTLLNFHDQLHTTLEKRFSQWSDRQKIGDIFLQMAPFLKMYITYLNNYQKALATLSLCEKNNADFRMFLERAHQDPSLKGLNIIAFLILPIQRIPRYRMLLEAVAKYTPSEHPDFVDLHGALDKINAVADQVNEQIRSAENAQRVVEVQTMMGGTFIGNLVEPHRRFIFAGELYKISRKAVQKRACFLFNDFLVYAKSSASPLKPYETKAKELVLDSSVNLQFKGRIDLSTSWIRDVADNKALTNAFLIVAVDKTYTFYATTAKQKEEWVSALGDAMNALVEKNPSLISQRAQINIPTVNGLYNFFTIPIDDLLKTTDDSEGEVMTSEEEANQIQQNIKRKMSNWSIASTIRGRSSGSFLASGRRGSASPTLPAASSPRSTTWLEKMGSTNPSSQADITISNNFGEFGLAAFVGNRTTMFFSSVNAPSSSETETRRKSGGSTDSGEGLPRSPTSPLPKNTAPIVRSKTPTSDDDDQDWKHASNASPSILDLIDKLPVPPTPPDNLATVIRRSQALSSEGSRQLYQQIATHDQQAQQQQHTSHARAETDDSSTAQNQGSSYRHKPLPQTPLKTTTRPSSTPFEPTTATLPATLQTSERVAPSTVPEHMSGRTKFVKALWHSEAIEEDELTLQKGQILTIITDDDKDWWSGRTSDGQIGWFPAAMVVSFVPEVSKTKLVQVLYDYTARTEDELDLRRGELLAVIFADDPHWAQGKRVTDGAIGWFPANIVALADNDDGNEDDD